MKYCILPVIGIPIPVIKIDIQSDYELYNSIENNDSILSSWYIYNISHSFSSLYEDGLAMIKATCVKDDEDCFYIYFTPDIPEDHPFGEFLSRVVLAGKDKIPWQSYDYKEYVSFEEWEDKAQEAVHMEHHQKEVKKRKRKEKRPNPQGQKAEQSSKKPMLRFKISSLSKLMSIPQSFGGSVIEDESGNYYILSDNYMWSEWFDQETVRDHKAIKVVFQDVDELVNKLQNVKEE